MGEPAQRGLDAAQHHRHIGEELLEDARVDDGGIFGAQVVASVGAVGIFGTKAAVGSILIDHRVHAAGSDAEEEPWTSQFPEVAVVAMPVGLGNDGHPVACRLETAPDDGGSEGGMVYIGIGAEEDDIHLVPAPELQFLARGGKEIGQLHASVWSFHSMKSSTKRCSPNAFMLGW